MTIARRILDYHGCIVQIERGFRYLATNADGTLVAFRRKPERNGDAWEVSKPKQSCDKDYCKSIVLGISPLDTVMWKGSLRYYKQAFEFGVVKGQPVAF